eukprot:TRINITY_DN5091_c2_g1_i3.p1 TRINITY_DN5091_c2_g1~~TRINITY_DN5091_c2_g1_i3.p1  ORF type:complete len:1000 (-),score=250.08 TRINITY_DN5091_c2_g1_i3:148-3147(-)
MDRSIRSRTSSTSSVRSGPATPAVTPAGQTTPGPLPSRHPHRVPSPDQLAASLSRLRAERALSNPATPAPTPNPSAPAYYHTLHPEAIIAGLSSLGGDEGIASSSVPGTPAPTPFSPSPSVNSYIQPEQIAASIARLREEGSVSLGNTQPSTPSATPAYPPIHGQAGINNLGIIPEHLAEGIAGLDHGMDEGLESGSNPCTPIPTPFSPSPAQHNSVLPEQLAAGIHRLKVEEGMSSGGSTGMPATPAPTPFSHGPGGIKPEDLAASISRLSVIQEQTDTTPGVAINILEATDTTANNTTASTLSNYFGSPQGAGDSIFDQLSSTGGGGRHAAVKQQRSRSNSSSGFHDVTINTPAKRLQASQSQMSSPLPPTSEDGRLNVSLGASPIPSTSPLPPPPSVSSSTSSLTTPQHNIDGGHQSTATSTAVRGISPPQHQLLTSTPGVPQQPTQVEPVRGISPQQLDILSLAQAHNQMSSSTPHQQSSNTLHPSSSVGGLAGAGSTLSPSTDLLTPESTVSVYATPSATSPMQDSQTGFPSKSASASAHKLDDGIQFRRPESPAQQVKIKPYAEAWIPKPDCKEVLDNMAATPGTYYPAKEQLTCPGVCVGSDQGDPVRDLVAKYQGESEAAKRHSLAADSVTTDIRGLQQLISSGNYRAALNLTSQLLTMYNQGKGKAGQISKHSQSSLQIWLTRLSLLVKLKLFSIAEAEAEPFGDLEKPDVFLQYYPELYGGRRGSLAPWRLRLLLAQIPGFCGKHTDSVNRLFKLVECVRTMIRNVKAGLAADGTVILEPDNKESQEALECWEERERQVLYALVNCCIAGKDFESAVKCLDMLLKIEKEERKASLLSCYGRLYLQIGSLTKAEIYFKKATNLRNLDNAQEKIEDLLDAAALDIGQGDYASALTSYEAGLKLCEAGSKQEKLLKNNEAVCLLYLGRLKEGVQILESSVTSDPANVQGNPMLNLCTLYELESSYALQKKIGMLGMVSLHSPDSFPTHSLKL